MYKILILGGSGILSTAVCQRSVDKGYDVTCVTRGNREFALPTGVKSIHCDVNQLDELISKLDDNYDAVFDFLTFDVNQLKRKLKALSGVTSQYFFVSSATAYKLVNGEIAEDTPLGNEYWDYGAKKVECENYIRNHHLDYSVKYTIIRPYVTYGNTRIPFAIIPDGEYWSLANRIICGKPILLWDDGKAICTLTHTSDFAKAFVGLVGNEEAYNQSFHITSNETLSWREVLNLMAKALNKSAEICSATSEEIIDYLPKYQGILMGDKARNRIFNNKKIVNAVPEFSNCKTFEQGISETIEYFKQNAHERKINYLWDGRIDNTIFKLSKTANKRLLHFASSEDDTSIKNRVKYYIGRYDIFFVMYLFVKDRTELKKFYEKAYRHYKKLFF